jgi:hypothetical protein
MLDSFLSRTLHHVMGPLHALRGTCELISGRLQDQTSGDVHERERNCVLLERAVDTVTLTTRMVADVSDLARFGEHTDIYCAHQHQCMTVIINLKFTKLR